MDFQYFIYNFQFEFYNFDTLLWIHRILALEMKLVDFNGVCV
jgi:hypothetical protein